MMGRIAHQNASKSSLKASSPSAASPSQIMAPSVLPTAYVEPMCSSELITSVQKVFNKNASTSAQKLSEGISSLQSSQLRFYHLPTMICIAIAVFLTSLSCSTTLANPVFVDNPQLAQFQSGRNIRHLPCIVRKSGRSGVCMFAIDCIKQNGTHLGTCIDRFYFGSCCQIKEETPAFEPEINDNSIDQNTISHFVHESTTLPTSALFKLTTELPNHIKPSSSSVGDFVKNVTQGYTAPATSTSTSSKPTKTTTSKRPRPPPAYTTHRNSQFVVRTTGKPTVAPTTIKPPRRKTTTARPVLTTDKIEVEQRIETTAVPTKFYTFQMVETTTPSATEPAKASDFVTTTPRPVDTTERTKLPDVRPIITSTSSSMTTSTITISTIPTTAPTTSILRTTHRPRPVTTKKPAHTKRPTSKPSRKPSVPLFNESTQGDSTQQTTAYKPSRRPAPTNSPLPTAYNEVNATFAQTQAQTTRAPRPKPKPTAEIVKVPKPVPGNEATTSAPSPTKKPTKPSTAQPSNVTTTQVPTKPTKFSSSTTTKRKPGTTPTSSTTSTTTSTASPTTTSSTTSATTTASSTTTEQYYTLTTDAPKVDIRPISTSTEITQKPGLITWTNVDGEPNVNISNSAEWIPQPDEPAWVPVSTIDLESSSNRPEIHTPSEALTTEASFNSSTDKFIVSIATSISEIMSNSSMQSSRPDHTVTSRPVKPTKNSTSTTNPPTSTSLPTSSTTENPLEEEFSTEVAGITDNILSTATGTGSNTIEYSTEDDNVKDSLSTAAPPNALEGMDFREICGRRMFPEPRIVGGSNAAFGRWPWQISLRQWRTSTYLHKCGAALLNENWAITAAHCVDNVPPSDLLLRLGEYDLAEEEEPYGYQERRVQIVASHPQFDPRTFEYDLALLRFYEPVIFQPNIIPVCVPNSDLDFIGQTAFVTGWGRLYEDGPLPSVLQEVAVPVINNTICESMYRAAGYIEHIPHIFICAGWKKGGYDSCEGDSGGPMVLQREEDKRFQLGGVISWGIGCAEANQPGVYTRISEFRDWINQILQFYFYEPVIFQPNIIPVCVPNSDLDFIGQTAFVTGWGRLYEDGPLPSVLQEVAVPVINNTICESMYRAAGYIEHIPHIFICAGWKKGGYDSCEGDSGGPMVLQREEDKRFQLGGVISWGIGCAEANQPGVYTRISEFRDWINQILQF